ncbi:MAG: zinc-binding dehydrogenase [Actinomycetes bacterium]
MRATVMYGAGDVRVEQLPDPVVEQPTDALVRVVRTCVCGSDLHPYHSMPASERGTPMGHEFIGVVEEVGSEVDTIRRGDFVIAPFAYFDNTCVFCREGLSTSCEHGGFFRTAQAEAVRVPLADGTLVKAPVGEDSALLPALLTLSDVLITGHHAAVRGQVGKGSAVTVIGDGAVGLLAVLAAKRLGAEQIVLMGRHQARTDLGREFGATDVVAARGEEGITAVRELTVGHGSSAVLECVGHLPAYEQALGVVRAGGVISRVGVPQYQHAPAGFDLFGRNITLTGGPGAQRSYIEDLLPDVLEGRIKPGRVFDRTVGLDDVPAGYKAMDSREALKVLVSP